MALDRRPIEQMIADVGEAAFQRLARLFVSETRDAAVEMRRLVTLKDWQDLGRQAHSLKNSAASFGLEDMSLVAYALERAADAARAGESAEMVERLEQMLGRELGALEELVRGL